MQVLLQLHCNFKQNDRFLEIRCIFAITNVLLKLWVIIWPPYIHLILLQVIAKKRIRTSTVGVLIHMLPGKNKKRSLTFAEIIPLFFSIMRSQMEQKS